MTPGNKSYCPTNEIKSMSDQIGITCKRLRLTGLVEKITKDTKNENCKYVPFTVRAIECVP